MDNRWAFIPIGCKLADFDLLMLATHWKKIGININLTALFNYPFIDIFPHWFSVIAGYLPTVASNDSLANKTLVTR